MGISGAYGGSVKKTRYGDYRKDVVFESFARYRVHVVFTDDVRKSCIKRYGICTADMDADAFCRHAIDGRSHLFLPMNVVEGTVSHEAWHVIYHMFSYVGVKDFDNETTAYHLGWLVEQIYKFKKGVEISCGKPS